MSERIGFPPAAALAALENATQAQLDRIERLGGLTAVSYANAAPFDLPAGYVYVVVNGVHYGIDPDGRASS